MYDIEELNEVQKRAVLDTDGAVLVTAGAGSGKTRLLTHRIAHLINDCGVKPYNVLAITFTNKAANEMRSRLEKMIDADGIWIFTFHAACVRILRNYIDRLGYGKNFTIYGDSEQKSVIKRICKNKNINDDMGKRVLSAISNAKNKGVSPQEYAEVYKFSQDADDIAEAYKEYQNVLKSNNALDYDDLLLLTLELLKTDAEAREFYQNKFRYIHIDEFQDTNVIQYEIVKLLAQKCGNIFAVGDEDQCIYTWRGASIANIFDFQRDFNCKVYKLEQNYRSTSNILAVANRIIKGNVQRLDKKLWTDNVDGEKVVCYCAATEGFEADYVVKTIFELTHDLNYNYSDCAVLLRLNALTRPFEERFLQYGIPHRVYGGFKFYDRKEIKDVLAYARLASNPSDDEAAYRIINFPKRHIGEASIEKLREYTSSHGVSVYEAVTGGSLPFNAALNTKLFDFGKTVASLRKRVDGDIIEFFKYLLSDILHVNDMFADDDEDRLENIGELVSSIREFSRNNRDGGVDDYLQTVSLYSDTDNMEDDDNAVTLATVHSAKGLEFPVVFVVALEDGTFPSLRLNENNSDHMEEERRLMYVAATRAKKRLYLTYSKSRFIYGDTKYNIPSRFLKEAGLVEARPDFRDGYTASPSRPNNTGYKSGENGEARAFTPLGAGAKFSGTYKSDYGKSTEKKKESGDKGVCLGATVIHRRLGKGKVIGLEKLGDNTYAKIDFETGGVMQLAVGFAPITVVSEE